jgi:hypothetical protein
MAPASGEQRAQLYREFHFFLNAPSTQPADLDMLSSYLRDQPQSAEIQSLVPEDEMEERLAIAKQMETKLWGPVADDEDDDDREYRRLTAFQLAVLMVMPLRNLRLLATALPTFGQFNEMRTLVKICMLLYFLT